MDGWMSGLCLLHLLWLIQRLYFRLAIWCVSCLAWLGGWLGGWLAVLCLFQVLCQVSQCLFGWDPSFSFLSSCLGFCFLFLFVHLPKTCQEKTNKRSSGHKPGCENHRFVTPLQTTFCLLLLYLQYKLN